MGARPADCEREFELLMRSSYGMARTPQQNRNAHTGRSVTMTIDAGTEVITAPGLTAAEDLPEYVVDRVPAVLPRPAEPLPALAPVQPPTAVMPAYAAAPAPPTEQAPAPAPPVATPMPGPAAAAAEPVPAPSPAPAQPMPPPSPMPAPAPQETALPASIAGSPLTDADLADDIRAILSGGGSASSGSVATPMSDPGRPMPDSKNEQAIFDKIRDSMAYSNSFDLGTRNLTRFEQFERNATAAARVSTPKPASPMTQTLSHLTIAPEVLSGVALVPGCAGAALTMSVAPERSVAMYDTGEHVLSAGDLYPDQLTVGSGAGVAFSYGQLISMGDFYATVDDLKNADPAELSKLKALIIRNTAFYRKPIGSRPKDDPDDISHKAWNEATNKRYLALADDNFAHFSPPNVLGLTDHITTPTNRSEWEKYHERAIAEMKVLVAAHPNASVAPFGPLATNAFGDHFLTDAFASGHLVNKEVVIGRFRRQFYQVTNTLTSAAEKFLAKLAAAAWARPAIRETFSPLELPTRDLEKLFVKWNVDTENAFRKLLVQIAEREPSKVENLVAKTLHDHLNEVGVEVVNDNGDGPWKLKGDFYLGEPTLSIMRKAVQQSVDNILSPEILVSEPDRGPLSLPHHGALIVKVWKYTPKPTAAGRAQVLKAIDSFTDLNSQTLLTAAADLLEKQRKLIADELIERKFLEHE
jgi:hypothetical protein